MLYFLQQLVNGLHIGALYALLAFGYALTYGVLHRTNLAYGPIFAFGGQTAILFAVFGWQVLWFTLPATLAFGIAVALAYAALAGFILARTVLEPLAGRSPNAIVAATLGVALVLGELSRIAAETRDFWLPPVLSQPVILAEDAGFAVTMTRLQVINCLVVAFLIATASRVLSQTPWGLAWRAVSQEAKAAALCGVDGARVFRASVVAGSLAAAVAGILAALHFGNISFDTGLVFGLKILFVTAVGSYTSPLSAALGALGYGIAESLWSGYFPIEWRDAWMFALLVALLVLRPIYGSEARAA